MIKLLLALIIGTWNGNWFPSGRAEHRAHPEVEQATITAAGHMLAAGIRELDPKEKEDVVLILSEIRNREVAEDLVRAIGRDDLKIAAASAYRRRDRFDQQQNVILTTLPVADAGWGTFKRAKAETPPRGYVYAFLLPEPAVTTIVYGVHLKSNYGATTDAIAALNRAKRTRAIDEILARDEENASLIVAGDFNADRWGENFANETIFQAFAIAGYSNLMAILPPDKRGTHPNAKYGDSCLDYIMVKGIDCDGVPHLQENDGLSDHKAVFVRVKNFKKQSSSRPRERRGTSRQPRQKP